MRNTGFKRFRNVKEYYVSNNQPTGREKPNPPAGQPDHAPPVQDTSACPLPGIVTLFEKQKWEWKEVDGPGDDDIYYTYYYVIIIYTNTSDPNIKPYYYQTSTTNAYTSFPSTIDVPGTFNGVDSMDEIDVDLDPPAQASGPDVDLVAAYNVDNYTFTF